MVLSAVPYRFLLFLLSGRTTNCITKCLFLMRRGKKRHATSVQGGSDPTALFGRLKAEKVGSLPPFLAVLPRAFSSLLSYASIPLAKTLLPRRVTLRLRLKLQSFAPANRHPISSHSRRIFPPGLALPWCEIGFSASA